MNDKLNNPPAFPTTSEHQNGPNTYHFQGMDLRDYFAAKAMQSLITLVTPQDAQNISPEQLRSHIAKAAYDQADAMLAEREKK